MDIANGTTRNDSYSMPEDPFLVSPIKPILITIYTLAFLLGLAGNLLVLFVIIRNKSMQTVTNFFLANLAVADLLVVIFCIIPKLLYYILPEWPLGAVVCKLHNYMISATSTASIFILTVISVERFIAILFPLRTRQLLTAPHLIVVISVVWISSAAFNIPQLLMSTTQTYQSAVYCSPSNLPLKFISVYTIIYFLLFYTFPLVVMTVLYGIISCKLYINTDNLHASTEKETKETDGRRFWQKFPTKVRYFVNSRGNKCGKEGEQSERSSKSADKKDADYPDEVQILMETSSPSKDGGDPSNSNQHKVGPFLLDEPSMDGCVQQGNAGSQCHDNKGNDVECIPLTSTNKPTENKPTPDDIVDNNQNKFKRPNQDSLPSSQQQRARSTPSHAASQHDPKRRKKKNKKEEVLSARKKVIRLLVTIVISFALCLFPVQLVAMWMVFGQYPMHMLSAQLALPLSFWLYFFNSALNPLLYAFLSDNFRRKMRDTLLPKSAKRRQTWMRTQTHTRSMMSDNTETENC